MEAWEVLMLFTWSSGTSPPVSSILEGQPSIQLSFCVFLHFRFCELNLLRIYYESITSPNYRGMAEFNAVFCLVTREKKWNWVNKRLQSHGWPKLEWLVIYYNIWIWQKIKAIHTSMRKEFGIYIFEGVFMNHSFWTFLKQEKYYSYTPN